MKNRVISNTLPGRRYLQGHIEHILENTSASTYWKDKNGKYLGANEIFLKSADLSSYDEIIGYTDLDFIWGEQQALLMRQNDKMVVCSGKSAITVETATSYADRKLRYYLNYKTPLFSRAGKTIGTYGTGYILDGNETTSKDIENAGFPAEFVILNRLQNEADDSNINLTSRQVDCLYYLTKGFSLKQIAKILQLSPRTVEHYIEATKQKLLCETRMELIEKAFKLKTIRMRLLQSLGNIA